MSFGLCNAPTAFHAPMNRIFQLFVQKFVHVFFNGILIYCKNWSEHFQHLKLPLKIVRQHQLFVKQSKFEFGLRRIKYLWHILSPDGSFYGLVKDWSCSKLAPTKITEGLKRYFRNVKILSQVHQELWADNWTTHCIVKEGSIYMEFISWSYISTLEASSCASPHFSYAKKLLALVLVVRKLRSYLIRERFIFKTNHLPIHMT